MKLHAEHIAWGVDGKPIVRGVSLEAGDGEFVGLLGPNGSGKSSLLRCIYRVYHPDAGLVTLGGDDVWKLPIRDMARRTAVVVQESSSEFSFTVYEIVMMGRNPHKGNFDRGTNDDFDRAEAALARVGMTDFAERSFLTLSGGEKQRVLFARALCQAPRFLILDEPTNNLDIRYQLEVLELAKGLGVTTLAVLHDLNLAAIYCDRLYVLQRGEVVASGSPEEVLQSDLIRRIYGVEAEVQQHPGTGMLQITFIPKRFQTVPAAQPRP
jgi:iron complex transport system ATP-binding protein